MWKRSTVFSFLRPTPRPAATVSPAAPAPAALYLAIDLAIDEVVAELLELDGQSIDERRCPFPEDPDQLQASLNGLLEGWPLMDCATRVTLTRDYYLTSLEVEEAKPEVFLRLAADWPLSFGLDEATFTWRTFGANRAMVAAYPQSTLDLLRQVFSWKSFHSLYFEALEFAQARWLESHGSHVGMLYTQPEVMQMLFCSPDDFFSISQNTALTGLEHFVEVATELWKKRGHQMPEKILTNGSPDFLARACRTEAEFFQEQSLRVSLARSPEGPHRYSLVP